MRALDSPCGFITIGGSELPAPSSASHVGRMQFVRGMLGEAWIRLHHQGNKLMKEIKIARPRVHFVRRYSQIVMRLRFSYHGLPLRIN